MTEKVIDCKSINELYSLITNIKIMNSLFSVFDPNTPFLNLRFLSLNWLGAVIIIFILFPTFWILSSQVRTTYKFIINGLILEISAIIGGLVPPGTAIIFLSLFFFIIFSNFIGLFPYIFTRSRHLRFTVSLAIPLWVGGILWSWVYQINHIFSHLVPLGTPAALIPLIVVIETLRNLIRPGALAVRLAANIVAGHLLLSLLGGSGNSVSGIAFVILIGRLLILIILECAVACIQSYVFTILRVLYLNELIRVSFNKNILK